MGQAGSLVFSETVSKSDNQADYEGVFFDLDLSVVVDMEMDNNLEFDLNFNRNLDMDIYMEIVLD